MQVKSDFLQLLLKKQEFKTLFSQYIYKNFFIKRHIFCPAFYFILQPIKTEEKVQMIWKHWLHLYKLEFGDLHWYSTQIKAQQSQFSLTKTRLTFSYN